MAEPCLRTDKDQNGETRCENDQLITPMSSIARREETRKNNKQERP